jgi:hypothetical protein
MVVFAGFTTWLSGVEVLEVKEAFPSYSAVIESVPAANFVVVKLATPPLSVAVPRLAVPFLNVTRPVGVPLNCGATVAVKVTDCPKTDGLSELTRTVVLAALATD